VFTDGEITSIETPKGGSVAKTETPIPLDGYSLFEEV
jgi:hypothetical protein